jgi:hypothetical protein
MKYLKPFNENREVFMEYRLNWIENNQPDEMYSGRLLVLIKYVKKHSIRKYVISGITKTGNEKVLIDIK